MKRNILTLIVTVLALLSLSAYSQAQTTQGKIVRKIYIRSADPQLIAMLLAGTTTFGMSPEPTSLSRMGNGNRFSGGFGGGGYGSGNRGSGFGGNGFNGGGNRGGNRGG